MSKNNKLLFSRMIIIITCLVLIVYYVCALLNVREGIAYLIIFPLVLVVYILFIILFERQCAKEKDSSDS
ncbi:hypothetical protein OK59_24270 [Salmonella enterica subsp. enterica]|nr:hypothetical protein [Salmonella enterica subsp. enterica serovar Lexington]